MINSDYAGQKAKPKVKIRRYYSVPALGSFSSASGNDMDYVIVTGRPREFFRNKRINKT